MLPAAHRMRASTEFAAVLRSKGSGRAGSKLLVVHLRKPDDFADTVPCRVGFVVSKAVGNSVVRHRTQRRLRHLMADRVIQLPAGALVVVRAQPAASAASSAELGRELDRLIPRALAGAA
ncbi:ribonuclease P protein component [Yimella sp. cx-51]|uniref:ribonuclease P protein component n=2 Tax=Yimella sp. cx-51 TaxID=2770551 RepID=UPI00165D929F|nr:ribonuclease P protein component [Yimella sp. cx-51]MBC9958008.1 ribonuclease P protein component [Yimella sp. cx-51]MBD2760650.1 ribonuclease P protein component [Yimella sp. cx-573]QTH38131.1 ribonuclease P protein component [Yimella sp. cx-51]